MPDAPTPTPTPTPASPPDAALPLCESEALQERGRAHVFDVAEHGQPLRAFALRFEGEPVAYLNRCAHVPTEMDWQEGEFLDGDRQFIMCSIHGAMYDPLTGACAGGACGGAGLTKLQLAERQGQVYWYPSASIRPVFED